MLFVDGGNDRVGIGTSSPAFEFHVKDASGSAVIRAENGADNKIVDLIADSTGGLLRTIGSYPLVFNTNQTERARIDSGGQFRINNTSSTGHGSIYNLIVGNESSGGDAGVFVKVLNGSMGPNGNNIQG